MKSEIWNTLFMADPTTDIRKVPPQNLEAERAVLGAILMDNDAVYTVLEILHPSAF